MSAGRTYEALSTRSYAWTILSIVLTFIGRRSQRGEAALAPGRGSSVDEGLAKAFGAEPDLEARHEIVRLPSTFAVLLGGAFVVIGIFLSFLASAVGVTPPASAIPIRVLGAFSALPFALAVAWSVRAVISELHYRRWVSAGRPLGETPPARSQPLNRDLFLALPGALALAWVFISI